MKRIILVILSFLCLCNISAQTQEDSLSSNRYVMRATLYGIGHTNILDTYLSPMEYTGKEIRVLRESMRMTNILEGKVSRQSLFQANLSLSENKIGTGNEIAFLANWNYAWHYQYPISENLKLMAGPLLDINGGFIYNPRNSNNPAQAKAYFNLGASGMAIYQFNVKGYPFRLRYQANIPIVGLMFSPEYGQPYYEMSFSHNWGKNLCITSLHNQPALRQFLTLDFPIRKSTVRLGYVCDIQQAQVKKLKSHTWSHVLMLGFVKHFYLINPN